MPRNKSEVTTPLMRELIQFALVCEEESGKGFGPRWDAWCRLTPDAYRELKKAPTTYDGIAEYVFVKFGRGNGAQ